jgi:hypothetical protein
MKLLIALGCNKWAPLNRYRSLQELRGTSLVGLRRTRGSGTPCRRRHLILRRWNRLLVVRLWTPVPIERSKWLEGGGVNSLFKFSTSFTKQQVSK